MITVFQNQDLIPPSWQTAATTALRVFNPSLLRVNDGWLLAYRVVTEPDLQRRIAICRLKVDLSLAQGSQVPFSDWIHFADPSLFAPQANIWFADPRLYHLQGRFFI